MNQKSFPCDLKQLMFSEEESFSLHKKSTMLHCLLTDIEDIPLEKLSERFTTKQYSENSLYVFLQTCEQGLLKKAKQIYEHYRDTTLTNNGCCILNNTNFYDFTYTRHIYDRHGLINNFKSKICYVLHLAFQLACFNNRINIVSWLLPIISEQCKEVYDPVIGNKVYISRIYTILINSRYYTLAKIIELIYGSDIFIKTDNRPRYLCRLFDLIFIHGLNPQVLDSSGTLGWKNVDQACFQINDLPPKRLRIRRMINMIPIMGQFKRKY